VRIRSAGLVTSVGLTFPSATAAIRGRIARFVPTAFHDFEQKPVIGSPVANVTEGLLGLDRLTAMLAVAVRECLAGGKALAPERVALLVGLSEASRAGRPEGLEDGILPGLEQRLGARFHPRHSRVFPNGRASGLLALTHVPEILGGEDVDACIVAGVDSFINTRDLRAFHSARRLKTEKNSDGFIPGEGAAAVLVPRRPEHLDGPDLEVLGVATGRESSTVESGKPCRADGLVDAIRRTLEAGRVKLSTVDFRLSDVNGERYGMLEVVNSEARTVRERTRMFPVWHAADCVGEVGAAAGPLTLAVALDAAHRGYAEGPTALALGSSDSGLRAAAALSLAGGSARG
jgi:3-oxoacyl-[acyl-carrier-protein] synthase I